MRFEINIKLINMINIFQILASYSIHPGKTLVFLGILPVALLLSYIKTLNRLAIASAMANMLQAVGIAIILEYLSRDISKVNLAERDNFRPFSEVALGFGSAMFAFEGISVVLPVYTRMKNSQRMSGFLGVINVSYTAILILYFLVGLFGFLKFGREAKDSITLNLPPEPIYDVVRSMFATSVFLTYPLQFYVPNEIIWNWAKKLLIQRKSEVTVARAIEVVVPTIGLSEKEKESSAIEKNKIEDKTIEILSQQKRLDRYEYYCRTLVVLFTFLLAIAIPKLNLLMDLIGSITGTSLSLILPAIIHMATFWEEMKGFHKILMLSLDLLIIAFGLFAGVNGSVFSLTSIISSFWQH